MNTKNTQEKASAAADKTRAYYQIKIVETGAQFFSSDYSTFNVDKRHFATLQEAKEYLKTHYGKARRQRIYQKSTNGDYACGWCYHFRNADWSHAPVQKWNQCDWVTVSEIKQTVIP